MLTHALFSDALTNYYQYYINRDILCEYRSKEQTSNKKVLTVESVTQH